MQEIKYHRVVVKYLTCEIKYIMPAIKYLYRFVKLLIDLSGLRFHIPEGRCQPCLLECLLRLLNCPAMIVRGQAVVVPKPGELPDLIHSQDFSTLQAVSFAPALDPFFRPEEEHGRSGKEQIIVPAGERQGEVNQ